MSKSRNLKIGFLVTTLLVSVASWVYIERSNQQRVSEQSDQSLDSGIALFKQKKYPEALKILENVPANAHREWLARYYQGSIHIRLKDYTSAATSLEQALILNPTETRIMHALGVAYFKLGNLKLSKAYYAKVLEIHPGDEEAKGLMDIMANLEKQQPGYEKPESEEEIEQ